MIEDKTKFIAFVERFKREQNWCVVIYATGKWDFYKGTPPNYVYNEKEIDFGVFTMGQLTPGIIEAIDEAIKDNGSIFEIERAIND